MGQKFTNPLPNTIAETKAAYVAVGSRKARVSLRCKCDVSALSSAIGVSLPMKIGTSETSTGLEALCLGPDEWLLVLPEDDVNGLQEKLGFVYATCAHSFVDISAREVTFEISGEKALDLMAIGCPRDVEAIPVGQARRTVFDGATVILWRDGPSQFRLDVWCSFAPYVAQLLETGAKELTLEMG